MPGHWTSMQGVGAECQGCFRTKEETFQKPCLSTTQTLASNLDNVLWEAHWPADPDVQSPGCCCVRSVTGKGTPRGICYQILNTLPFHRLSLPCPTIHTFHKASLRSVTLNTSLTSTADVCHGGADSEILGTFQKRAWLLSFLKTAFLFPLLGSG